MADEGDNKSNACSVSRKELGSGRGMEEGDVSQGHLNASCEMGPVLQDHTSHSSLPFSEEVLEEKKTIDVHLKNLKTDLIEELKGFQDEESLQAAELEDMQRALRRFQTLKDIKQRLGLKEQAKILQYFGEEPAEIQKSIIKSLEWHRCCLFANGVVLDPDSAHPHLSLSEDRKSVIMGRTALGLPDSPERFDAPCVLGFPRLTSGIHYWEVEVGEMREWILGVCYESVRRKGVFEPSPENGVWAVGLWDGYRALTTAYPGTPLCPRHRPRVVGVFLNFEAGSLTFYNVEDRCQLVTFPPTSFSQPLRPYFCTWDTVTPLRLHPLIKLHMIEEQRHLSS